MSPLKNSSNFAANNLKISIPDANLKTIVEADGSTLIWDVKKQLISETGNSIEHPLNYGLFLVNKKTKRMQPMDDSKCLGDFEIDRRKEKVKFLKMRKAEVGKKKDLNRKNKDLLFIYIRNNDTTSLEKLLSKEFDPNTMENLSGETPLTLCARLGDRGDIITKLHKNGAILDYRNSQSQTALHVAVQHENREVVAKLLFLGMSLSVRDKSDLTPLYYAVKEAKSAEMIKYLLNKNSPLNCSDQEGNTELHQACCNHGVQVVALLLHHGADIEAVNNEGNTPFHLCVLWGNIKSAAYLAKKGVNFRAVNNNGKTPLEIAKDSKNERFVHLLNFVESEPVFQAKKQSRNYCSSISLKNYNPAFGSVSGKLPKTMKDMASSVSLRSSTTFLSTFKLDCYDSPEENYSVRTLWFLRKTKNLGISLRGPPKKCSLDELGFMPSLNLIESVTAGSEEERAGFKAEDLILEIDGKDVRCFPQKKVMALFARRNVVQTFKLSYTPKNSPQLIQHRPLANSFVGIQTNPLSNRNDSKSSLSKNSIKLIEELKSRGESFKKAPPVETCDTKVKEQVPTARAEGLLEKARKILLDYDKGKMEKENHFTEKPPKINYRAREKSVPLINSFETTTIAYRESQF